MKIALLQYCASRDKTANLARAISMAQEAIAQKSKIILLPEAFNFRGNSGEIEISLRAAEALPGPSSQPFIHLAKKHKISFLLGSILEKSGRRRLYNTSVFIGPTGSLMAKYRKIHLFDARIGDKIIREADIFRPGKDPVTVTLGPIKMGLSICYDLRFPDLYQGYAGKGVQVLTVPSCFTRKTGEAHWETLLRARAIENLAYVLAPNQVGMDQAGTRAHGHSMVISPWGEILAQGSGDNQEIVFGELDFQEVRKARAILPGIIKS